MPTASGIDPLKSFERWPSSWNPLEISRYRKEEIMKFVEMDASEHDVELYTEVRALARDKYGWGTVYQLSSACRKSC